MPSTLPTTEIYSYLRELVTYIDPLSESRLWPRSRPQL